MKRFLALLALTFMLILLALLVSCGTKKHTHAFSDWSVTKAPTCTADGVETRTCNCGLLETRSVAAQGHEEAVETGSAPTCTSDGKTDKIYCANCSETLIASTVIPATGHTHISQKCENCDHTVSITVGLEFVSNGDGTCYVSGLGNVSSAYIVIPEFYNEMRVTGIGKNAFHGCDFLLSVIFPESIITLGEGAFSGCTSLKTVTLSAVTAISKNCFYGCSSLVRVAIPEGVISIDGDAFYGCASLKTLFVPTSVVIIASNAFDGSLELEIQTSHNKIPDGWATVNLSVKFSHVHKFGEWIITRAPTCSTVGIEAQFCDCGGKNTAEIDKIPHTEDTIKGKDATCTETGLTDGKYCTVCETVTLAQETIPTKPHTEETIKGKDAACTETGLTDGKYCTVCSTVTVEQVEIPVADHSYANGACTVCGARKTSTGLKMSKNSDGTSYCVTGLGSCKDTDIVIPAYVDGLPVTAIGEDAFRGAKITSVFLPEAVTNIGRSAFAESTVRTVTLSVGMNGIEEMAFYYCASLEQINLPEGLRYVRYSAFEGCTSLKSLYIPSSVTYMGYDSFVGCRGLTVYCAATSRPTYWEKDWADGASKVEWGYTE